MKVKIILDEKEFTVKQKDIPKIKERAKTLLRCKMLGHKMIKETRSWAPPPFSQEPSEFEYCLYCGFGIPVYA